MIVIAGATGLLGSRIARTLMDRGDAVRVLVRSEEARKEWEALGAEAVMGDLRQPESLEALCRGADVVITTATSAMRGDDDTVEAVDRQGNRNLIDAARSSSVGRFVFVSASGASPESRLLLFRAKAATEAYLRESGLPWTIVAPHLLMEVWIEMVVGVPVRAGKPVSLVGQGRALHSFISIQDVAAFVAEAATRPEAANRKLDLGGPVPVSWREIIEQCQELVDSEIEVRYLPPGFPLPHVAEPLGSELGLTALSLDQSDVAIDSSPLYQDFGIQPTPLRTFLVTMLADRRRPFRGQPAAAPAEGEPFDQISRGEEEPAPPAGAGENQPTDERTSTRRNPL
jgi:uncharacterized protein YbjT (DUF2867 family)